MKNMKIPHCLILATLCLPAAQAAIIYTYVDASLSNTTLNGTPLTLTPTANYATANNWTNNLWSLRSDASYGGDWHL